MEHGAGGVRMGGESATLPLRSVGEWELRADAVPDAPFAGVRVDAFFGAPSGASLRMPAYYDGNGVWRVRFSPGEAGRWTYAMHSHPPVPGLEGAGAFEATPRETRGFLKATPGEAWGFRYEGGEPALLLGDTVYNLFGMAFNGLDVSAFLRRRAAQGFNLLRVRLPVSLFHPPEGYNQWQTRRTWPWGGSEQAPRFDQFNLEYFRVVDRVVREAEELGIGLELIMEAWGFEFPFNSRQIFLPEWEELWLRYLVARYDAYTCTYVWTLMNEYEYYPNGDWHYKPAADRWAMRMARWLKAEAPHGHVVAVHNGPAMPPFAERFAADPGAVDAVMFQTWGATGEHDAWTAAGIEETIERSLAGWCGSAMFAEWGYERNPALPLLLPGHEWCGPEHTRRGAWRGAFRGLGVIHGWENSWGPFGVLDRDQPGLESLLHLRRFFVEVAPFHALRPALELVADQHLWDPGEMPLALAAADGTVVAAYLPVGGHVSLTRIPSGGARWFDPRTGEVSPAVPEHDGTMFVPAEGGGDRPWDWVLVVGGDGGG